MPSNFDVQLPRNVEAEAAIIGGMLCENNLIDHVADVVRAEDFFEPLHGRLFEEILRERDRGRHVSPITLMGRFREDATFKELGGPAYLAKLTESLVGPKATTGYAHLIATAAQRRRIIADLLRAAKLAANMDTPPEDIVAVTDAALSADTERSSGVVQVSAYDAFWQMVEENSKGTRGVTASGLQSFNEAMGPARRHHLCIVAGRPGMGKTALALSYGRG